MSGALTILSDYGIMNLLAEPSGNREEVNEMELIFSFVVSVIAGVVSHYICKWLDRGESDDK